MTENKTKPSSVSVSSFLETIQDKNLQNDCRILNEIMEKITRKNGIMWGSIAGYGTYRYKYSSGKVGDWMVTGFSPRKQNISIYIIPGFKEYKEIMTNLGTYKTGVSCLYIKKLSDIKIEYLEQLISNSVEYMKKNYDTDLDLK